MAKNGNASAMMKELLSNLFKYANPILNTALGFKATGSRLCIWQWTLSNDSASQHTPVCSLISNHVISRTRVVAVRHVSLVYITNSLLLPHFINYTHVSYLEAYY